MALFIKQVFPRFSRPVRPTVEPLVFTPYVLSDSLTPVARLFCDNSEMQLLDETLPEEKLPATDKFDFGGSTNMVDGSFLR